MKKAADPSELAFRLSPQGEKSACYRPRDCELVPAICASMFVIVCARPEAVCHLVMSPPVLGGAEEQRLWINLSP